MKNFVYAMSQPPSSQMLMVCSEYKLYGGKHHFWNWIHNHWRSTYMPSKLNYNFKDFSSSFGLLYSLKEEALIWDVSFGLLYSLKEEALCGKHCSNCLHRWDWISELILSELTSHITTISKNIIPSIHHPLMSRIRSLDGPYNLY